MGTPTCDVNMALLVIMTTLLSLASSQRLPLPVDPLPVDPLPVEPLPVDTSFPAKPPEPTSISTESPVNATYWLAMSDKIRPGFAFQVSGQILKGTDPVSVQVTVHDESGEKDVLKPPPVTMTPGGLQSFSFDIPLDMARPSNEGGPYYRQHYGSFKVTVEGNSEMVKFKHEKWVRFQEKAFSIFIQTDKGMYKPGQIVKFRVLTVFPDMKAITDKPYDIFIKDPGNNRVVQWLGVKDPKGKGVLDLDLQLADEVITGDWTIVASILGREETKTFEVDNYVLPRFEVSIDMPPYGLASHEEVNITVKATYTFGEPVTDGYAVVSVQPGYHWARARPIRKRGVLSPKNGTVTVRVSAQELTRMLNTNSLGGSVIKVDANVTERHTGRKYSAAQSTFRFHSSDLKLRFVEEVSPNNFKPGLPYTIYTEVKKPDGTLFSAEESEKLKVYFNVTYDVRLTREEMEEERKRQEEELIGIGGDVVGDALAPMIADSRRPYYPSTKTLMVQLDENQRAQPFPANGMLTLTFKTPLEAESMRIQAWGSMPYLKVRASKWLSKAVSPSNSFLRLIVGTGIPKVGQMYKVTAEATDMMTELTYQVYSKGVLLVSNSVTGPPEGAKALTFDFKVTRDMTPSISLVAFYMRKENHEVVVDAFSLSTDGLFQKPMTIEFSKDMAQPGDKVDVRVKAEVNSTVYLLSADKSAVLLKGGNDITQETVTSDMARYSHDGDGYGPWPFMFAFGCIAPYRGNDAQAVLQSAGVLFLSDGQVYSQWNEYEKYPELVAVGDMAPQAGSSANDNANKQEFLPVDVVRKFFPEVWLWKSFDVTLESGGEALISEKVPDTLTSWVTTGFSLHPESGLSIVEKPTMLTVVKPMFVTLDLPATIVRNETFCFTASVFSYYNGTLPVLLTLARSDKFTNVRVFLYGSTLKLTEESATYSYYLGELEQNEVRSEKFCFSPKDIGPIPIQISALTSVEGLSDGLESIIVAKPEGVPRATNYAAIPDLSTSGQWEKTMDISFPDEAVEGSEVLEVSASGNVLGSVFDNLEGLMKMPTGCGEQNMLNFAPNIFLLEFYMSTGTLTPEIKSRAVKYMLIGYQKENTYRHKTGGFSAFGNLETDDPASTWLTAFVVKCYALAQQLYFRQTDLLAISPDIMSDALNFLAKTQSRDGSFVEYGKVFHKEMQGASAARGVSLTAYTLIAMQEARQVFSQGNDTLSLKMTVQIDEKIAMARQYLEDALPDLTDNYDICLTTYALHLVNSPLKDTAFARMDGVANMTGNLKFWERPSVKVDKRHHWTSGTDSINIEMTSYALLVYSLREGGVGKSLPIIRWLTQNKGPNAGFYSTQDTVIGLQALSRMGGQLYSSEDIPVWVDISVSDMTGNSSRHRFSLSKENELLLQIERIPVKHKTPVKLDIKAGTESGQTAKITAIVEATLRYNIKEEGSSSKYIMDHSVSKSKFGYNIKVAIRAPAGESRSMSVLVVDIPPGMSPDMDHWPMTQAASRVEVKGERLVLYFETDKINSTGVKLDIDFILTGGVLSKPEPRYLRVYDYYEPKYEVTQQYHLDAVEDAEFCSAVKGIGVCSVVAARQDQA